MRSVQVYVEGQRIELYNDEKISVNSSQQNITEIDSVRTDYSQTFTVPASNHNNKIFKHFYQSDTDSTIDHNIRRSAHIEIDLIPFRKGYIQLEKSKITKGQADNYYITFYGDTVALKDSFGEDLLSDMSELSNESFAYTQVNVLSEIQDSAVNPIKFPLITNREVTYADGSSTDVSHSGSGAIHTNELFPAINMETLFNTIQTRYALTFNGTFLESDRFKRAYLYCKNAQDFTFITKQEDDPLANPVANPTNYNTSLSASDYFSNGELTLTDQSTPSIFPNPIGTSVYYKTEYYVLAKVDNLSQSSTNWYLDVYINGALSNTLQGSGNGTNHLQVSQTYTSGMTEQVFTFKLRGDRASSGDVTVRYVQKASTPDGTFDLNYFDSVDNITLSSDMDVISYLPNMKVLDFFKGVLNMFNLTCYNTRDNTFQIEPLDDWYQKGGVIDITPYVDIDKIDINRVPLYKNIEMRYKESKSRTNETFNSIFKKKYGDAKNTFNYDGGDYKIELPFENLMQTTFRGQGSDLQVGITLDSANSKYVPEPMILYMSTYLNADFNINNGTHVSVTGYVPFGQDLNSNGVDFSLNFSADNSTLLGYPIQQNLFATYYYRYLANLYDLKNRNVSLKANFPTSLLTSLELNDRLVIRDKRYTINDMTTDVTSGEVTLNLLHDLRPTLSETGVPPADIIKPDNSAQCLDIRVLLPNKCVSASISGSANITSITPTTITEDSTITVCIPENSADLGRILTEDSLFNLAVEDGSGDDVLQEESASSSEQVYLLTITYTFQNGSTSSSQQIITQEP